MGNAFTDLLDLGASDLLSTAGTTCAVLSAQGVTLVVSLPCVFTPSAPSYVVEFGGPVAGYSAYLTVRKADIPSGVDLSPGVNRISCNGSVFRIVARSTSPLSSTVSLQLSSV